MTINYGSSHNRISEYINARNNLRADSVTEQQILERVALLPVDGFRDFARESFQLGAGYGHAVTGDTLKDDIFICDETNELNIVPHIMQAFFNTLPRNRHIDPEHVVQYQQTVAALVAQAYTNHSVKPLHPSIDTYQFEAFVAFIEGYQLVAARRLISEDANYRPAPL